MQAAADHSTSTDRGGRMDGRFRCRARFARRSCGEWFFEAVAMRRLGRKRVLDTMVAATYRQARITSLLTLNGQDFEIFGDFTCMGPVADSAPDLR